MHKKQTDGKKIPAKAAVKRLAAGGLSVLVAAASANGGLAVPVLAEDNHEILREETVPVSDAADPEDSGELVTEEAPEGRDSAGESQQPAVTEQPEITEIPQEQEENEEEETREEVGAFRQRPMLRSPRWFRPPRRLSRKSRRRCRFLRLC